VTQSDGLFSWTPALQEASLIPSIQHAVIGGCGSGWQVRNQLIVTADIQLSHCVGHTAAMSAVLLCPILMAVRAQIETIQGPHSVANEWTWFDAQNSSKTGLADCTSLTTTSADIVRLFGAPLGIGTQACSITALALICATLPLSTTASHVSNILSPEFLLAVQTQYQHMINTTTWNPLIIKNATAVDVASTALPNQHNVPTANIGLVVGASIAAAAAAVAALFLLVFYRRRARAARSPLKEDMGTECMDVAVTASSGSDYEIVTRIGTDGIARQEVVRTEGAVKGSATEAQAKCLKAYGSAGSVHAKEYKAETFSSAGQERKRAASVKRAFAAVGEAFFANGEMPAGGAPHGDSSMFSYNPMGRPKLATEISQRKQQAQKTRVLYPQSRPRGFDEADESFGAQHKSLRLGI
jgi:hypothetical protein